MGAGPGYADAEGIYQYGEDDLETLMSDLLNVGQQSVTDALTLDRARLATLEAAPQTIVVTAANAVTVTGLKVRRVRSRVFIEGTVSRATDITAALVGGTLPVGARPSADVLCASIAMTAGFTVSFCGVIIGSNGNIQLNAPTAAAANARYVSINCSYEAA